MSPYQVHKDGGKRKKMKKRQTEMMKEYDENKGLETHVDKFEKKRRETKKFGGENLYGEIHLWKR